jgi:hypothetical protein
MRRSFSLIAIGALTALAVGSAAALDVDGGAIQAGVDQTLSCDADGVFVAGWGLEADDGTVRSVRINGIDGACFGNALFVTVYDGSGALIGQGSADPIDAVEESVALPTWPLASAIEQIHIFIEGSAGS